MRNEILSGVFIIFISSILNAGEKKVFQTSELSTKKETTIIAFQDEEQSKSLPNELQSKVAEFHFEQKALRNDLCERLKQNNEFLIDGNQELNVSELTLEHVRELCAQYHEDNNIKLQQLQEREEDIDTELKARHPSISKRDVIRKKKRDKPVRGKKVRKMFRKKRQELRKALKTASEEGKEKLITDFIEDCCVSFSQ